MAIQKKDFDELCRIHEITIINCSILFCMSQGGLIYMSSHLFTNIGYLQKALDGTWQRDEIISHNISNIDTPNYKSQGISFEEQLHSLIQDRSIKGKNPR